MDIALFRFINDLAGQWGGLDFIGRFSASWLIWIMVAALLVIFGLRKHTAFVAFYAAVVGYLLNIAIGFIFFRARPFVTLPDSHLLVWKEATEKSFPSDHATVAFAIAFAVYLVNRQWGIVFLVAALLVGLGRIFVGVHYPSDVLTGAVMGIILANIADYHVRPK